ncbi:MAG: hypothetical protein HOH43_21405 [Candidatus Latescibacteria bacterium]|nr:hypothetical protein [Candidatus Latescibacterota bacterium]
MRYSPPPTIGWLSTITIAITVVALLPDLTFAHRTQGPLQGFRDQFSGTPAIEKTIVAGIYDLYFCAFDMGHEVHIITYAKNSRTGDLYQDMVRLEVHGPDGTSLTVYRDHATQVLDEPVRWEYDQIGVYDIKVALAPVKLGGLNPAAASFSMPLNREGPTSTVLVIASSIIVVTLISVVVLKKKRASNSQAS